VSRDAYPSHGQDRTLGKLRQAVCAAKGLRYRIRRTKDQAHQWEAES
jgi:hypothetical protein